MLVSFSGHEAGPTPRLAFYAVLDCATANPRLLRVPDPFGRLLASAKGSVLIGASQIQEASDASA